MCYAATFKKEGFQGAWGMLKYTKANSLLVIIRSALCTLLMCFNLILIMLLFLNSIAFCVELQDKKADENFLKEKHKQKLEENLVHLLPPDTIPVLLELGRKTLYWTAPGDDGDSGQAAQYDFRYWHWSNGPIDTEDKWLAANRIEGEPTPSPAGQVDSMVIDILDVGDTVRVCIKTGDEVDNWSGLSNSPLVIVVEGIRFIPGDANGDGYVLGNDVTYLVRYFRSEGQPPDPFLAGDANGDCRVIGSDVTYLVRWFRVQGEPPLAGDCD